MSAQKRGRACIACASIKIKCQLGGDTSLQPPCERCVRLNKECILSAPKRQKDRVAELEAQVANLTRMLESQGITSPDSYNAADTATPSVAVPAAFQGGNAKKRRLSLTADDTTSPDSGVGTSDISKVDQIVPLDLQQRALDKYLNEMFPHFPLVPIRGDSSLDALRRERPLLLQAIIYAAGRNLIPSTMQEDFEKLFLNKLPTSGTPHLEGSLLETLQALQIASLWYCAPRHHKIFALHQMITVASELTGELGMAGPIFSPAVGPSSECENIEAADAWRAWLVSHLLSVNMSHLLRKHNANNWTEYTNQSILYLMVSQYALPTDQWLSHYFRAEHLCERIAHTMDLSMPATYLDLSDPETMIKIQTATSYIRDWRALAPLEYRTPTIVFLEHLATVYMYEVVLHTPTNKHAFAAPYAPECLSVSDFPAPVITQDYISALYKLLSALHAMIDTFTTIDLVTMAAQSASMLAARVAYAHYLLARLYIATTAPGNTFGSVLDASLLRVEEYADKIMATAKLLETVVEESGTVRILGVAHFMKTFYSTYNSNLASDGEFLQQSMPFQLTYSLADMSASAFAGNQAFTADQIVDWDAFSRFSDSAANLGLDTLFADAPLVEESLDMSSYQLST